jgi:hypothetical protein
MAAGAAAGALQHALTNMGNEAHVAAGAVGAFAAAGGPAAAHVGAAVTAAIAPLAASIATLQTQVNALQNNMQAQMNALQNNMQAQMNGLEGHVIVSRSLAARAWNGTCGDGITRPYEPVPNNAGATAPPGIPAVRNVTELLALTGPQLTVWCNLYGAAPAAGVSSRRAQLAALLGVPQPPL